MIQKNPVPKLNPAELKDEFSRRSGGHVGDPSPFAQRQRSARPNGIAYLVGRLDHVLNRRIRESVAQFGITAAQYTAMSVIRAHGQLSNAQLAERSMVSPQSANEMVKIMAARGWISRESAAFHGRIIHIGLTQAGAHLLDQCDAAVAEVEATMLGEMGEDDMDVLHAQLRNMVRSLSVPNL